MVRIIAGTLIKIGGSDMEADAIKGIIDAADRGKAGPTAPAWTYDDWDRVRIVEKVPVCGGCELVFLHFDHLFFNCLLRYI